MAYVRPTNLEEDEAEGQGTTLSSGAGSTSSLPGAAAAPTAPQTQVGTGMPDLLAYVRANKDQAGALGAEKAGEIQGRIDTALEGARTGKNPDGSVADTYGDTMALQDDLNATTTQEGREALFGDAGSRGGKALDSYLVGQSGSDPLSSLRSQYGDLLGKVEPFKEAPSPNDPDAVADYNAYLQRRGQWDPGAGGPWDPSKDTNPIPVPWRWDWQTPTWRMG